MDLKTLYIPAGASVSYRLQGPNNFIVSQKKLQANGYFFDLDKYCRHLTMSVLWDLAINSGGTLVVGRHLYNADQTSGALLVCERTTHCKLECPEMVGFEKSYWCLCCFCYCTIRIEKTCLFL